MSANNGMSVQPLGEDDRNMLQGLFERVRALPAELILPILQRLTFAHLVLFRDMSPEMGDLVRRWLSYLSPRIAVQASVGNEEHFAPPRFPEHSCLWLPGYTWKARAELEINAGRERAIFGLPINILRENANRAAIDRHRHLGEVKMWEEARLEMEGFEHGSVVGQILTSEIENGSREVVRMSLAYEQMFDPWLSRDEDDNSTPPPDVVDTRYGLAKDFLQILAKTAPVFAGPHRATVRATREIIDRYRWLCVGGGLSDADMRSDLELAWQELLFYTLPAGAGRWNIARRVEIYELRRLFREIFP